MHRTLASGAYHSFMSALILIVEDEPHLADVLEAYAKQEGFRSERAADGHTALSLFRAARPDLVLLDIMLPGRSGLDVLRSIRSDSATPVILVTARAEETDHIVGLELGADDYVVKPFSPAELVARVDAVLRRVEKPVTRSEPLVFGDIRIDPAARSVTVSDERLLLTQREFDLLLFMARHPLQVFSRNQLMDAVWQYSFYTDTSTVTVHVRRLRAKLERDPSRPDHLETVWGVGYRFSP